MDTTVDLGVISKEINKQNKGHDKQNTPQSMWMTTPVFSIITPVNMNT